MQKLPGASATCSCLQWGCCSREGMSKRATRVSVKPRASKGGLSPGGGVQLHPTAHRRGVTASVTQGSPLAQVPPSSREALLLL